MAATLASFLTTVVFVVPSAQAGTANAGLPGVGSNPIGQMTWGVPHDTDLWNTYESAKGLKHTQLGRIAMLPRAVWLGWETPSNQIKAQTAAVIAASQNGNPNALTEIATFLLNPWEPKKATGADTQAIHGSWNVSADETWYRNMAAGIGKARTLVIEQVDLPVARKVLSKAPETIDTYAAKVLSANPHTTLYIDGGTFGWVTAQQDAQLLIANGIRYARGFALDNTDYDPTVTEDLFGARVVAALNALGVTGKHFIVNTDENGQPYKPYQVPGRAINDTPMCHGSIQTVCQRTGIPPTADPSSLMWSLGKAASAAAKLYCDGYVWSGNPWTIDAGPYAPQYALWLAQNGEY